MAAYQRPVIPASTRGALHHRSRRQCRVHIPGGAARLSRCRVRLGMKPTAFVELRPPVSEPMTRRRRVDRGMISFAVIPASMRWGPPPPSRSFSAAFTVPQTLQVTLLGNYAGSGLGMKPIGRVC